MNTTNGQVFDAVEGLRSIADPHRPRIIPQIGKYRLAKLLTTLEGVHAVVNKRRAMLVQALGKEEVDETTKRSYGWTVPEGSPEYAEFIKQWNAIREEPIEISSAQPIMFVMLGNDPKGIEVGEFKLLGDFVVDNTEA